MQAVFIDIHRYSLFIPKGTLGSDCNRPTIPREARRKFLREFTFEPREMTVLFMCPSSVPSPLRNSRCSAEWSGIVRFAYSIALGLLRVEKHNSDNAIGRE